MKATIWLATICAAIFMVTACDLGPPQVPPPNQESPSDAAAARPATTLTPAQVNGVLGCEETIQHQGAQFTSLKESALNECLDSALTLQLGFEMGKSAQISTTRSCQEYGSIVLASSRRLALPRPGW